jgi:hypothetical protein
MALATPSEKLAESIMNQRTEYLEKIHFVPHDWLQQPAHDIHDGPPSHYFRGVPDTVSDVKGCMVYVQAPAGLELAWRVL